MTCYHPIKVPRLKDGVLTSNTVPCGSCIACLSNKRDEWSFRLEKELEVSSSAWFVTLTYEDNSKTSLSKRDFQLFMKRLRKAVAKPQPLRLSDFLPLEGTLTPEFQKVSQIARKGPQNACPEKLRYYAVGEYGGKTGRPHYHIILFNMPLGSEALIVNSWNQGFVKIGSVTGASIAYVTKYCISPRYNVTNRTIPFSLMSTKPPIGLNYVDQNREYHQKTKRFYTYKMSGVKTGLPRIHRELIFSDEERKNHAQDMSKMMEDLKIRKEQAIKRLGEWNLHHYQAQQNEFNTRQFKSKITKSETL